jgi:hypothetical protein
MTFWKTAWAVCIGIVMADFIWDISLTSRRRAGAPPPSA